MLILLLYNKGRKYLLINSRYVKKNCMIKPISYKLNLRLELILKENSLESLTHKLNNPKRRLILQHRGKPHINHQVS